MAEIIKMPKMSDTMEEGIITAWLKKEGDEINSGDILAEVETDKATMELESYHDGVLLYVGVKEKESVPVDGILAVIGEKGEDYMSLLKDTNSHHSSDESKKIEAQGEKNSSKKVDTSHIKASVIRMPKMSDTMEKGIIASWLKKKGDLVEAGDILAEVETDKATMELEAYEDGTLLYIAVEAGSGVPVNSVIAIIGEEGTDYEALLATEPPDGNGSIQEKKEEEKVDSIVHQSSDSSSSNQPNISASTHGRIKSSPLARNIASEKGIELSQVTGSGTDGRIVKKDVEHFVAPELLQQTSYDTLSNKPIVNTHTQIGEEKSEKLEISQMRKVIAKRLSESKFTAPHFYLTMEIIMDKVIEARQSINEMSPTKISFNDLVVKAVASALRQHPKVNVSWYNDHMLMHQHIHIGVAVAIPDGLIVPVIRFADNKSLSSISYEIKELGEKAKNKQLQSEEFSGNTFTISNLGMFGIEEFTAIINPPDACIMAIGGIKETVIVKDGEMKPGNVMKVTLSCDHRAVDGAVGSAFLKTFKQLLEDPVRILI